MVDSKEILKWLTRATAVIFCGAILFIALAFYLKIKGTWPELMPFDVFHFWFFSLNKLGDYAHSLWWVLPLLWVMLLTSYIAIVTLNDPKDNAVAEAHFIEGTFTSIRAGVLEELVFRWVIFLGYIAFMVIIDNCVMYMTGYELVRIVYQYCFEPIANWFTLGFLSEISGVYGWAVGAAMLAANGSFRDGHVTNGPIGWINSWFVGMYLFWVMMNYGLLSAIVFHFLYDFVIFLIRYIDMAMERAEENAGNI